MSQMSQMSQSQKKKGEKQKYNKNLGYDIMMQSYPQGHWIEDSEKIRPKMQEKALGFSWALG